ncbi:succinyl-diaminopimelate desuccinylase [Shewanella sp. Scap07]|uniref:succinyl-diaminopimelate desuccinylase n=1 Tax=Shewanella sp. Scap07 TaxID=2589987 RepID=UPI0015C13EBE|nr:succinyl-diaminopimelate desuccinylase [Shewanella sp. Scap07]QLE84711.1 succinyl-diaminopimelate desuccinylase [Shewanella sp. Scap07]
MNRAYAYRNDKAHADLAIHKAVAYTQTLVAKASVTPDDAGCQDWVAAKLTKLGFNIERFVDNGVTNTIASLSDAKPVLALAGHTDVVPPGARERWHSDPFVPTVKAGYLIGRGAVDMKSGVAVMLAAVEDHFQTYGRPNQNWQFLLTSDEEGEASHGTQSIVKRLAQRNQLPQYCLIAEPTADQQAGDVIKIGRRGAISAKLIIQGRQGHVAYPDKSINAVHIGSKVACALAELEWDKGSDDFPGTSLQVTYVNSGEFTDNVVPGSCEVCFNLRYSHRYNEVSISQRIVRCITKIMAESQAQYQLEWQRPCTPYHISDAADADSNLLVKVEQAIVAVNHRFPRLSTSGGTSDGRFLSSAQTQVIELGLPNKTIHQVNEQVELAQVVRLYDIYRQLLQQF